MSKDKYAPEFVIGLLIGASIGIGLAAFVIHLMMSM